MKDNLKHVFQTPKKRLGFRSRCWSKQFFLYPNSLRQRSLTFRLASYPEGKVPGMHQVLYSYAKQSLPGSNDSVQEWQQVAPTPVFFSVAELGPLHRTWRQVSNKLCFACRNI